MNILSAFTRKNLLAKKKRTALTLAGIALSVAMMVAVSTFLESYMERGRNRNEATAGQWTARFFEIPLHHISDVTNRMPADTSFLIRDVGFSEPGGARLFSRPYLLISQYDETAFEKMNVVLTGGRMPQNENELLIPEDLSDFFTQAPRIGETISFPIGDRILNTGVPLPRLSPLQSDDSLDDSQDTRYQAELLEHLSIRDIRQYTVVGTMKRSVTDIPTTAFFSCLSLLQPAHLPVADKVTLYLHNQSPPARYSTQIREVDALLPSAVGVELNDALLTYYPESGGLNNTFYTMSFFILGAIFISALFLIYNSFSISSAARTAQLGLLASVGTTQRQKKNTVLKEGLYVSLIGIPLGVALGLSAINLLLRVLDQTQSESFDRFPFVFSTGSIAAAAVLAIISILFALLIPALRAARIMPLEAIQMGDAPSPRKKIRKRQGWMRIFKVEGVLAQENIRSNKRQKRALVLSLALSLTVFLCVSYYIFTAFLEDSSSETVRRTADMEFSLQSSALQQGDTDALIQELKNSPRTGTFLSVTLWNNGYFLRSTQRSNLSQMPAETLKELELSSSCQLLILDDEVFAEYLKEIGENPDFYLGRPIAVMVQPRSRENNAAAYKEADRNYFLAQSSPSSADSDMYKSLSDLAANADFAEWYIPRITIGTITTVLPELMPSDPSLPRILFVSESYASKTLTPEIPAERIDIYLKARGNGHRPLENEIRELTKVYSEDSFHLFNFARTRETLDSRRSISGLLSFVFLFLIGTLAISNSLNSLSTSLELRRREFSMLRSVGMSPAGFRKMLLLEGLYYCVSTLLLALPLSLLINSVIFLRQSFSFTAFMSDFRGNALYFLRYALPDSFLPSIPLLPYISGIAAVFVCIFVSQHLSVKNMRAQNIVEIMRERSM